MTSARSSSSLPSIYQDNESSKVLVKGSRLTHNYCQIVQGDCRILDDEKAWLSSNILDMYLFHVSSSGLLCGHLTSLHIVSSQKQAPSSSLPLLPSSTASSSSAASPSSTFSPAMMTDTTVAALSEGAPVLSMAASIPLQSSMKTFPVNFGSSLLRNEAGMYGYGATLLNMDLITFPLNRGGHWILCSIVRPSLVKNANYNANNLSVVVFEGIDQTQEYRGCPLPFVHGLFSTCIECG